MTDFAALVRRSLDPATATEFDDRVRAQADRLIAAIEDGAFDNEAATLGLELEAYAVDRGTGRLADLPEDVFEGPAAKELGLHNVELNADPATFDGDGIAEQAATIEADLADARTRAADHGLDIVLDAMWTVPPAAGTAAYLNDVAVLSDEGETSPPDPAGREAPTPSVAGPVVRARNMRADPRYGALDNTALSRADGSLDFSVPGVDTAFRSILFESLATSIQPHVQVPDVAAFPRYHNLAVRTLGPLLALSSNSPFLPADCYDLDATDLDGPAALVDATHHELRIAVFEQSMNQACRKVRVPDDLSEPTDAVAHVVADDTYAPFLSEWLGGGAESGDGDEADPLIDAASEFDYKRGTFWRWVRGVVGGDGVAGACDGDSLRIEYRPLPTQPTVRDIVGLQVLTAGLLRGLDAADHPLTDLPNEAAERSFYAAVAEGIDAELAWVDADGGRTDDTETVFDEVFAYARRGLAEQGVDETTRERYLAPLERRRAAGVTPSAWKKERVREALADGADLATALERMQAEYVRLSRETDTFAEWL